MENRRVDCLLPEGDNNGRRLSTGSDERDNEEKDEEGDQGVACAVALPGQGVAVLVQVCLDDDELQLVAALTTGRRRYNLPALDAGAIRVVTDLQVIQHVRRKERGRIA